MKRGPLWGPGCRFLSATEGQFSNSVCWCSKGKGVELQIAWTWLGLDGQHFIMIHNDSCYSKYVNFNFVWWGSHARGASIFYPKAEISGPPALQFWPISYPISFNVLFCLCLKVKPNTWHFPALEKRNHLQSLMARSLRLHTAQAVGDTRANARLQARTRWGRK